MSCEDYQAHPHAFGRLYLPMSMMLRYCTMFQWHPELTKEIHAAAFESLPSNSQFCHYLTNATAVTWNSKDAKRVEPIKSLPKDFIFEAMWLQPQRAFDYPEWDDMKGVLDNPCLSHNHSDFEKEIECRKRTISQDYIFCELIRTCEAKTVDRAEMQKTKSESHTFSIALET
jgi:hypothetical protein